MFGLPIGKRPYGSIYVIRIEQQKADDIMLISIAFGALILASTFLVGNLFAHKIPKPNSYLHLAGINLAGMATLVWLASIAELAKQRYTPFFIAILLVSITFLIPRLRAINFVNLSLGKRFTHNFEDIKYGFLTLSMGLIPAALHSPLSEINSTRISFRIGPDLAGWTAATKYFCENTSREKLSTSIVQQLGLENISQAFRNPIQFQNSYIGRAPSFTDQVTGEFLIGANRVGLPKFLSGFCTLAPDWLNNIMVGGVIWAVVTMCFLIIGILKMKEISPFIIMATTCIAIFNVNTLSVLMEGGYGQFISTPFLISAVFFIQKKYDSNFSMTFIAIFVMFSLNAYQDVVIIFAVFFLIYFLLYFVRQRHLTTLSYTASRKSFIVAGVVVILNVHQLGFLFNLLLERIKANGGNGLVSGWDQGKIAFPINILGVFNWLPYSSVNHSWGLGIFLITIFLSLLFLVFLVREFLKKSAFLTLTVFISYLIISLLVYRKGLNGILTYTPDGTPVRGTNNYQVWKLLAYGTPVVLINIVSDHAKRFQLILEPFTKRAATIFILSVSLTSMTWMNDWIEHRSLSINTSDNFAVDILDKYDILIIGNWAGSAISLTLEGDVRYFLPSRGFQLSSYRSLPVREIAYLLPKGQCFDYSCLSANVTQRGLESPEAFKLIYEDSDVIAFLGTKA